MCGMMFVMNRRTFLIAAALLTFPSLCFAGAPTKAEIEHIRVLLNALRVKESGGKPNRGRGAKGDKDKNTGKYQALGPYQIWKVYWTDSRVPGTWERCLDDLEYSEVVVTAYFMRYERAAYNNVDCETLSRLHNGGPGWRGKKEKTDQYWIDVRNIMAQQKAQGREDA